ncbi:hypothetical protein [Flavobacterium sp. '19STA2R22 D10 B1']|uniref:hypothetical protein n=1 Tax=Flavobacterium aerium TaxID=3037261 RepID=UPI00278C41D7|nr:hypothetical protein [Flavobacterium sp. '19STA2R22 D10 B1']
MRFILLLILVISVSSNVYAQFDVNNKSMAFPRANNTTIEPKKSVTPPSSEIPPLYSPNAMNATKKSKSSLQVGKEEGYAMPKKTNEFVNPGIMYEDRLNRKGTGETSEDEIVFRRNQYLGDFKSKADRVRVRYRDHQAVDGDAIKVSVNDVVLKSRIILDSEFQGFDLELNPGFNKIDFEALNQGSSGPNTAEFQVYDDKGNIIAANRWDLATGFKATIIIVKEAE